MVAWAPAKFIVAAPNTSCVRLLISLDLAQCAKEVMSDSPGLVDFVIRLVDSDHHLPDGQVKFFGN